MQHLQPNTTLQGGKYRIERVLGQGGFGNTYVGVNTVFNEQIAIKEFFIQGINDRLGSLLALHDGGKKFGGEAQMVGVAVQLMAKIAIAGSPFGRDDRYTPDDGRQAERFIHIHHAVFLQLLQCELALACQIA